jgi:hypothetical protein
MRSVVELAAQRLTGTVTSAIIRKPFRLALDGNVDLARFPERLEPPTIKPSQRRTVKLCSK